MNAQKVKYTTIIGLATVCLLWFSAVATAKELHVPSEYKTIQSAIDAAFPMDTVKVARGTYSENIVVKTGIKVNGAGKNVTTITASSRAYITEKIALLRCSGGHRPPFQSPCLWLFIKTNQERMN